MSEAEALRLVGLHDEADAVEGDHPLAGEPGYYGGRTDAEPDDEPFNPADYVDYYAEGDEHEGYYGEQS